MTTKDEPAYPILYGNPGLTKLELFAAMAMQGLITNTNLTPANMSIIACDWAEALINELEKRE